MGIGTTATYDAAASSPGPFPHSLLIRISKVLYMYFSECQVAYVTHHGFLRKMLSGARFPLTFGIIKMLWINKEIKHAKT